MPILFIDWHRYLQTLIDLPSFEELRRLYVPIGIVPEQFVGSKSGRIIRDLPEIVEEGSQTVLLGEPGSGKTWAMRHLVLTQAAAYLRGDDSNHVPIYGELRDWHIPVEGAVERPSKVEVFRFLWQVLQQFQPDLSLLQPNEYQAILEKAFQGLRGPRSQLCDR